MRRWSYRSHVDFSVLGPLAGAGAASAGELVEKGSMHFVAADVPIVGCADGTRVGLGFHVNFTRHEYTDASGELTRTRVNMQYDGYVENLTTGQTADFGHGARTVTFNLLDGTSTSNGNYRTLTLPGAGAVLKVPATRCGTTPRESRSSWPGPRSTSLSGPTSSAPCLASRAASSSPRRSSRPTDAATRHPRGMHRHTH